MTTFAVLGTGPSMSQALADRLRGVCRVVAVSDAYKLAPWADALVSNDRAWWKQHPEALKFAGRKFAGCKYSGTEYLMATGIYRNGSNSGLQGLRVAEMLGATRILLLGFDMHGTHYFGEHPAPLRNTTAKRFAAHIAQFKGWYGPKVINCTPGSALRAFPMMEIEDALDLKAVVPVNTVDAPTPVANSTSVIPETLVSSRHAQLYQEYYARRGIEPRPSVWLSRVEQLAHLLGARTIIDYGCGGARAISKFSRLHVTDYDPGVPECAGLPAPADLVVSIHALEHVEPQCVDAVIDHMMGLARVAVLLVVSCEPSSKTLPDGSPWHCFVQSAEWWRARLKGFQPQPGMATRVGAEYAALYLCKPHGEKCRPRFAVDPTWTDKDSKVPVFRELYESRDFLDAYAAHTDLRIQENVKGAIGREDEWETHGLLQLKFLKEQGLKPSSRLLDIGCGPGRAARRLVPYLDADNYVGIDIASGCLQQAIALSRQEGWDAKRPRFMRNGDVTLDGPPFDYMWAHSVFTHLPAYQIETMVEHAASRLVSGGRLLFTYRHAEQEQRTGLKQFRYPFSFFRTVAARYGLHATMLDMMWPASQRTGLMTKVQ